MAARSIALLHNILEFCGVDLFGRLRQGEFLSATEVNRIADLALQRAGHLDVDDPVAQATNRKVVSFEKARMRHRGETNRVAIKNATAAMRIKHMRDYLQSCVEHASGALSFEKASSLKSAATDVLDALLAHAPKVRKRNRLGARLALDEATEARLLEVIRPDHPENPWRHEFVRNRNQLIVLLSLGLGIRRGELLGLRVDDIHANKAKIDIARRADSAADPRIKQPNAKTFDRTVDVSTGLLQLLLKFINRDRNAIKAARKHPYIFVSDEGAPLSWDSISKLFATLRQSIPELPRELVHHVLRHGWNYHFSKVADQMGMKPEEEAKARAYQQGWSLHSGTSQTYTTRHTREKGREVELKHQQRLEESARVSKPDKT